ncbi:VWA domain-containing protein [Fulvimonas sp. R45]|uniref:tetratricopeptide repeat protein n=1 Tax=Fulvimonas sp. R45 TaxID=3045937 RepID=UPI00265F2E83|nr:VWA domain-containing protein [Fulvimonas sp. R45]MDO1529084.1 VWA domain-containing protein [Fulvimonas sp. R45]
MSEALRQFHFLQPWWLLALLALPPLLWLGAREGATRRALARLADAELLPHLLHGQSRGRRLPSGLLALGWLLGALALAGPTWSRVAQPLYADRAAQVVAISLSQRMLARDVAPSRIDRARYKARDLLEANRDGLNALVGYAGEAFVVAPLTSDAHSLDDLLEAMVPDTMPVDGNDAAQAIARGAKLIHDAGADAGSLVLITDTADAAAQAAARKARAEGVRVSVLGVGTPQGGPVPLNDGGFLHDDHGDLVLAKRDDAALAALAAAGGGRYVPMRDDDGDIRVLHGELRPAHETGAVVQRGDAWQDQGPWLLLPLLLVVAAGFRRGWLLLLPLVLLPSLLPAPAQAAGWPDWWRRPDQQAAAALRAGRAKQAEQLARDPALRGAAAYRAGDYAAAAQALRQAPGADAAYNLGNALARQQDYRAAIKAYDRALRMDPHNEDARYNRQLVEDAMRRQQHRPQQQPQQGGQGGQGPQDKSAGSSGQGQSPQGQGGQQGASQDKHDGGKAGQDDKSAKGDDKGEASKPSPAAQQGSGNKGEPPPSDARADGTGPQQTQQQRAAQQAQAAKAEQALHRQMDRALGPPQPGTARQPAHDLGAASTDDPLSKLPADVRQALRQVPDDPGALLRRKFQLEYRERHGGAPTEDGP